MAAEKRERMSDCFYRYVINAPNNFFPTHIRPVCKDLFARAVFPLQKKRKGSTMCKPLFITPQKVRRRQIYFCLYMSDFGSDLFSTRQS